MRDDLITDDDLNMTATIDDRLGSDGYREQVTVGPVRGAGAVKGIFNPANRKRLFLYAAAVVILVAAILYSVLSVEEEDVRGSGSTANTRLHTSSKNEAPSQLQIEEANRFNSERLAEIQKTDPNAHPLLIVGEEQPETIVNPFQEERIERPSRVSEAVPEANVAGAYEPRASRQVERNQTDLERAQDDFIKSLVESEGSVQPRSYNVDWSYAEQSTSTTTSLQTTDELPSESSAGASNKRCSIPLVRAGAFSIATTDMAINSDVGGPVSITIRDGKLRNVQLLGSFERKEVWLRIELTRAVTKYGTLPIEAIGLDLDTSLNAVKGEVDHHILYRYGFWGLGTVMSAVGKAAAANANTQVIVSDGTIVQSTEESTARETKIALGELGQEIGEVMRSRLDRPITASMNVGDELGVFFMNDVCASTSDETF